jgi:hypothetical protein
MSRVPQVRTVPIHATKTRGPKAHIQTVVGVKVGGGVPVWIQGSNSETAIQEKPTAKDPNDVKATTREACDVLGGASSSFASPSICVPVRISYYRSLTAVVALMIDGLVLWR